MQSKENGGPRIRFGFRMIYVLGISKLEKMRNFDYRNNHRNVGKCPP